MAMAVENVDWPESACCCTYRDQPPPICVCGPAEKALRGWIDGRVTAPMSPEQREACLCEIAGVEGYTRQEYENATDAELSRGTVQAWTDFCRDKGMLG